jgi:pre-mRNA-splicing factor SYF1
VAIVNDEDFATTKGKSKHDYWLQLCEIISKHSEDIKNLKVDALIRGGVTKFSDEVGKLWITLADYHIRLAHFDKVTNSLQYHDMLTLHTG